MNAEERQLLERTLSLAEDNNRLLKKVERRAHWSMIWGAVKLAILVVPIILGYLYIQPYIDKAVQQYQGIQNVVSQF